MASSLAFAEPQPSRSFVGRLLNSTTFGPSMGEFARFGVAAALRQNGRIPANDGLEGRLTFTVAEARRRLSEIVSGGLNFASLSQFSDYLKSRFVSIEKRTFYNGNAQRESIVLRDDISLGTVNGAAVHPSLTAKGIGKLTSDAVVDAKKAPSPNEIKWMDAARAAWRGNSPNLKDWGVMKMALPAALRDPRVGYVVATLPLANPQNPKERFVCAETPEKTQRAMIELLTSSMPKNQRKSKIEQFMAQPEDKRLSFLSRHFDFDNGMAKGSPIGRLAGFVGLCGPDVQRPLECVGSPAQTRRMLHSWLVENKPKSIPSGYDAKSFEKMSPVKQDAFLSKHFVFDRLMTPRTSILVRSASVVPAAKIHSDLSAAKMAQNSGNNLRAHWIAYDVEQKANRRNAREDDFAVSADVGVPENVIPFQRLEERMTARALADVIPDAPKSNTVSLASAIKTPDRIVLVQDDTQPEVRVCKIDNGDYIDVAVSSIHELPPNDYPKVVMGLHDGFARVGEDRSVTWLDTRKNEHNEDGPSHILADGKATRWAYDGDVYGSRAAWAERVDQEQNLRNVSQPSFGGVETDSEDRRFGYS